MPESKKMKTQEEVAHSLLDPWGNIKCNSASAIAANVYQPLLDEIKRLEKRVEALERSVNRLALNPMHASGLSG